MTSAPEIRVMCNYPYPASHLSFTHGRVYTATHYKNTLYSVRDDLGRERYIIPDAHCPHLAPLRGSFTRAAMGKFETVTIEAPAS